MAKHTKRRAPRAPFIITVTAATSAMALAVMPGCGGTVVDSESTGGNPSTCPAEFPPYQSACTQPGLECTYPSDGCPPVTVACESGTWQVQPGPTCNPPPPDCPPERPEQGSACTQIGNTCFFPSEVYCADEDVAYCGNGGTWELSFSYCNPPPPDACFYAPTEEECLAYGSMCRWLVPGCADTTAPPPALEQPGCFPSADCASNANCWGEDTCQARVYNPCYNQACDACGATAMVCLAP